MEEKMITGELKNRIDSLWDDFAAGGIVNPLTVIEQITYLMFIHDLDEADNKGSMEAMMLGISHESIFKDEVEVEGRTVDGKQLKWSVFQDFPAEKMFDVVKNEVFPFIINLHSDRESAYSKYMSDAIFMIPTPLVLLPCGSRSQRSTLYPMAATQAAILTAEVVLPTPPF